MTKNSWLDWSSRQLGDLSRRLARQGYDLVRIEYLSRTHPEFRARYAAFIKAFESACDAMAEHPEGYTHYETLLEAKRSFLLYTNENRASLLYPELAESA